MFDCTELKTFLTAFLLSLLFVCSVILITPNPLFTDGHVINTDGALSQPHDLTPLTSKPLNNPSTLYICLKIIRFGIKLRNVSYM